MPAVKSFAVLDAVYKATLKIGREAPTTPFMHMTPVFRSFPQGHFVVDTHRHVFRRDHADRALVIPRKSSDDNRWTGNAQPSVPAGRGGLYCSVQGQATINEAAYYFQRQRHTRAVAAGNPTPAPVARTAVLTGKCVVRIRLLGHWLAADLSPRHNPGAIGFLGRIEKDPNVKAAFRSAGYASRTVVDLINDSDDCSVARGIGLALDETGHQALMVETARQSERSPIERGDNLIFFGALEEKIRNLSIDEAYIFPVVGEPERYPVSF
ncbi:hypothetical protein LuPra_02406 [Luteitalea pratensis]|uniref:RES domain-containing protein n=2 Tax=Luteitalea pratensis TaxID=1855912 RepID=A0A143PLW4_LUTPR|nr:hypothetical protein LuPra_02406 [Luteitalea pratensis]